MQYESSNEIHWTTLSHTSPSPQRKVPNQKIIQQSPGNSRNCFTLNHRPVNHHIPSQQSRPTIGHLQAIIRDFRWDTHRQLHSILLLAFNRILVKKSAASSGPEVLQCASGSNAHTNGGSREICHSVIRDARMSGRCETLPTSHDLTRQEVLDFSPHPAIYVSRMDLKTKLRLLP